MRSGIKYEDKLAYTELLSWKQYLAQQPSFNDMDEQVNTELDTVKSCVLDMVWHKFKLSSETFLELNLEPVMSGSFKMKGGRLPQLGAILVEGN